MIRHALAAVAILAAPAAALAQVSDDTNLAIELGLADSRTIFVSGPGGTLPVFSVCLDRVNGKTVYLHIAETSTNLAGGTKQLLPEGGCLFASGKILFLSTDATNKEPGFEAATALVTVSIVKY